MILRFCVFKRVKFFWTRRSVEKNPNEITNDFLKKKNYFLFEIKLFFFTAFEKIIKFVGLKYFKVSITIKIKACPSKSHAIWYKKKTKYLFSCSFLYLTVSLFVNTTVLYQFINLFYYEATIIRKKLTQKKICQIFTTPQRNFFITIICSLENIL